MIRSSKKIANHAFIVAIVIGAGLSIGLFKYFYLNKTDTKISFKYSLTHRLVQIHPKSNGLFDANIAEYGQVQISSGNNAPAKINDSIGYSASNL